MSNSKEISHQYNLGGQQGFQHRPDLDAMRIFATIVLIFFHTALLFAYMPNRVLILHSEQDSLLMTAFLAFIDMWHMPFFFLVSGAGIYYALEKRSGKEVAKERIKRLLIPFILCTTLLMPIMGYLERLDSYDSYLEYYPNFFDLDIRNLDKGYPIGNFSYYHLWFALYLFIISLFYIPLFLWLKKENGKEFTSKLGNSYGRDNSIFLLAIPIILIELFLRWRYPTTFVFHRDWCNVAHYSFLFVLGFIIVSDERFEEAIDRYRKPALKLGFLFGFLYIGSLFLWQSEYPNSIAFYAATMVWRGLGEWCMIIGIFGYLSRKFYYRQSPRIEHFNRISYPMYIWHFLVIFATFIIITKFTFVQRPELNLHIQFYLIALISVFVSIILAEICTTNLVTRFIFGIKKKRKGDLSIQNDNSFRDKSYVDNYYQEDLDQTRDLDLEKDLEREFKEWKDH